MGQISIPFTFDPVKRQIFLTIPYDVKDTGLGYKEMVIPYEYNTNPDEPDIFIPVNVGGSVLSVPINITEPTITVPSIINSLGINQNLIVPFNTIPWQQSIEFTGTGEINVWWEETVADPPIIIDDGFYIPPIIDDDGLFVEHPIYVPSPPPDEPIIADLDPPYVTYPEEPDHPIPSIILPIVEEGTAPRVSIPFIPYIEPTEEAPTPRISIPFTESPIISDDETYLPPPILELLDIASVDVGNDSQITAPIQQESVQIPYTIDPNNQNRLLVPYTTSVDEAGNSTINLGNVQPEPVPPALPLADQTKTETTPNFNFQQFANDLIDQGSEALDSITNSLTSGGPLASLQSFAPNTPYSFDSLKYPEDIAGSSATGHYVNFFINVAKASKYLSSGSYSYSDPGGSYAYSTTSAGTAAGEVGSTWSEDQIMMPQEASHTRISQAISLYIPDSMNYSQGIEWESASLLEAGASLVQSLGGLAGSIRGKSSKQKKGGGNVSNTIKSVSSTDGDSIQNALRGMIPAGKIATGYAGMAMNPQLLVLFRGIGFRSFQYDFYFTPRNAGEAAAVRKIIRAFRFHAHPELSAGYGVFYISPSTFDIEFMHKGALNTNIHKVKTCALIRYDVDYAPFGWSTYKDGMPVQTRLSLQFQELQIVTKEDIEKGF